jgi:hypothetical protein
MLPVIIYMADKPYFIYIAFLVMPTYLVWKLFGFEIVLRWYFALWPAIAIYFFYAHGHRFFKGYFPKEILTYGLPLMPIVILLAVSLFKKIRINSSFTLWVATLCNMWVSFWFIYDWYLGFLKKLPKKAIPEKVAAMFWREDWWLLGVKALPMLVGSIGLVVLIYKSILWINRKFLVPRRQKKKAQMLKKLQEEFGVTQNFAEKKELGVPTEVVSSSNEKESGRIDWIGKISLKSEGNKVTLTRIS